MNAQRLYEILRQSLVDARQQDILATAPRQLHSERATTWVKSLALNLRNEYAVESIRVFARPLNRDNDFKLNELLYDIVVLKTAQTHGLTFVSGVEWEIESELSRNLRNAVIDFSKLVLGAATNKLFIGSFDTESRRDVFCRLPMRVSRMCMPRSFLTPAIGVESNRPFDFMDLNRKVGSR